MLLILIFLVKLFCFAIYKFSVRTVFRQIFWHFNYLLFWRWFWFLLPANYARKPHFNCTIFFLNSGENSSSHSSPCLGGRTLLPKRHPVAPYPYFPHHKLGRYTHIDIICRCRVLERQRTFDTLNSDVFAELGVWTQKETEHLFQMDRRKDGKKDDWIWIDWLTVGRTDGWRRLIEERTEGRQTNGQTDERRRRIELTDERTDEGCG